MSEFKKTAALEGIKLIKPGMSIGLGAGATIAYLVEALAADSELARSLTLLSSSAETRSLLEESGFEVKSPGSFHQIDLYFDGCDQVDRHLDAFKSGAGIHTDEKILATMATEFVILVDSGKLVDQLDATYPLVIEFIPESREKLLKDIREMLSPQTITIRSEGDEPKKTSRNNLLADIKFHTLPALHELNAVKQKTGVIEHSLFFRIATRVIAAGPGGIETITRRV
ncbi:MAG: ribose 5-phosphate isomerase A [Chitinophagaceae bacterium]|nr:MAG: ribose 5-phosphate isomerase A [Chitinophagaceae bacterium]